MVAVPGPGCPARRRWAGAKAFHFKLRHQMASSLHGLLAALGTDAARLTTGRRTMWDFISSQDLGTLAYVALASSPSRASRRDHVARDAPLFGVWLGTLYVLNRAAGPRFVPARARTRSPASSAVGPIRTSRDWTTAPGGWAGDRLHTAGSGLPFSTFRTSPLA